MLDFPYYHCSQVLSPPYKPKTKTKKNKNYLYNKIHMSKWKSIQHLGSPACFSLPNSINRSNCIVYIRDDEKQEQVICLIAIYASIYTHTKSHIHQPCMLFFFVLIWIFFRFCRWFRCFACYFSLSLSFCVHFFEVRCHDAQTTKCCHICENPI